MLAASKRAIRFVRLLLDGGEGQSDGGGLFRATLGDRVATLERMDVAALVGMGVLVGDVGCCRPTAEAAKWLRRQLAEADPYAAQHRQEVRTGMAA